MQSDTQTISSSSAKNPLFQGSDLRQPSVFVTQAMQNNNVTSDITYYNPTFMFIESSSCPIESNSYFDNKNKDISNNDISPPLQGDGKHLLLLTNNNMAHHHLPQFKYQTSSPSYPSTVTAQKIGRHSTENLKNSTREEQENDDDDDDLNVIRSRSMNNMNATDTVDSSKREKILEKNRQAASRCRQRKKEWLNQLQTNVDRLTRENRILEEQSMSLREEILNLKTILLSHRDCSQSNKPNAIDITKVVYKNQ